MARPTVTHRCADCGAVAQRWVGRCPECGAWNALVQEVTVRGGPAPSGRGPAAGDPVPLGTVDLEGCRPRPTGVGEVDRVLAGGLLPGSVTLLYGEPGVGKSTLLLQVLCSVAAQGRTVLLVSAEEAAAQVRARAERLGPLPPGLLVSATVDLDAVERAVRALRPDLVVVDSVQTVADPGTPGPPGSLAQVRSCMDRLVRLAKDPLGSGGPATAAEPGPPAVVLVGHVTKEGGIAGPRALEHLVDTVVSFEGDRHHALRLLRAVKHRFGPTGEVGLFEMGETGLADVADPGPLLLGDRRPDVPGSAVTAVLQGRRPLLVEVQALVCVGGPGGPRRTALGLDGRRLATVVAVLEARVGVELGGVELFASAAGGIRSTEPATDLPLALAVASAAAGVPLPRDLVSFGEVGLAGEVRQAAGPERRLAEAGRLGFTRALVPASTPDVAGGAVPVRVRTVADAVAAALQLAREERATRTGSEDRPGCPGRPGQRNGPGNSVVPAGTMPPWSTAAARP
ncbi:MAG TPA: DNA repair protein RadA [Acidimicrobiales bacterium]|nr:DNA repair protein RadA [Acidimicrobiales bacterium]